MKPDSSSERSPRLAENCCSPIHTWDTPWLRKPGIWFGKASWERYERFMWSIHRAGSAERPREINRQHGALTPATRDKAVVWEILEGTHSTWQSTYQVCAPRGFALPYKRLLRGVNSKTTAAYYCSSAMGQAEY